MYASSPVSDVDFASRPWTYPGTPAATSGLLQDGRFVECDPGDLQVAPRDSRTAVVAIGSNASPGVIHRKLSSAGVATTVPFYRARLHGVAAGHSAHVSRHGYIPVAPRVADAVTAVSVSWFDDAQLGALDATEPNYVRRLIAPHLLDVGSVHASTRCWVYASAWGVLTDGLAAPVAASSQSALFALLMRRWPPYARLAGSAVTTADVVRALSCDPCRRTRWQEAFVDSGWAVDSGLERWPAARGAL